MYYVQCNLYYVIKQSPPPLLAPSSSSSSSSLTVRVQLLNGLQVSAVWSYPSYHFDVHRAVHRNIISIVKPNRCTNVSNLFYFGMTLYMFQTVSPSIIRVQDCTDTAICLLAKYLFDKCLLLYVQSWTPDDGRKYRPKHVECHSKGK